MLCKHKGNLLQLKHPCRPCFGKAYRHNLWDWYISEKRQCFHETQANYTTFYHLHKTFSRFWLVKATRVIHHNKLLLTKFAKNFVIIERWRQTSGLLQIVQSLTSKWRQKCSPLQIIEPLTEKPGDEVVLFKKKVKWLREGLQVWAKKIFWIIRQLSDSAFVGYDESWRSQRILSTSAFGLGG